MIPLQDQKQEPSECAKAIFASRYVKCSSIYYQRVIVSYRNHVGRVLNYSENVYTFNRTMKSLAEKQGFA